MVNFRKYEDLLSISILIYGRDKKLLFANTVGENLLNEIYLSGISNSYEFLKEHIKDRKNIFKTTKNIYGIKYLEDQNHTFFIFPLTEYLSSLNDLIDINALHHEIKNPLTAINGVVQLIEAKYEDEYLKKCSDVIKNETEKIKYLLEKIGLLFELNLSYSLIDVSDFLKKLFDKYRLVYSYITFFLSLGSDVKYIYADREKLQMVFDNLIKNASEAKGTTVIEVSCEIDPAIKFFDKEKKEFKKMLKFCIRDNGSGIEEKDKHKLFTPFWSTKSSGKGLGLVISKEIVEKHFGKIEYSSIKNIGTTFNIYLPV